MHKNENGIRINDNEFQILCSILSFFSEVKMVEMFWNRTFWAAFFLPKRSSGQFGEDISHDDERKSGALGRLKSEI